MAVNKVTYGGETLIDLTGDTVTADKLAQGITAHDASGAEIIGTLVASATKIKTGTFSISSNYLERSYTVSHGLGKTPTFAFAIKTSYAGDYEICSNLAGNYGNVTWNAGGGSRFTTSSTLNATNVIFQGGNLYLYGTYRYVIGVV